MTTRALALTLYRNLMKQATTMSDYNFRSYAIRRVRVGYQKNRTVTGYVYTKKRGSFGGFGRGWDRMAGCRSHHHTTRLFFFWGGGNGGLFVLFRGCISFTRTAKLTTSLFYFVWSSNPSMALYFLYFFFVSLFIYFFSLSLSFFFPSFEMTNPANDVLLISLYE